MTSQGECLARDRRPSWPFRTAARGARARRKLTVEGLEDRWLPAAALPDIAMVSATTTDSRSVSIDYQIQNADIHQPITFGVYRSAEDQFDSTAIPVGTVQVFNPGSGNQTLDQAGLPATAVGNHEVTLPLAGGLPPNPQHPFVLVVADPANAIAESSKADNTASFRKYVIGIITHGGVQPKSWKNGPPWELRMAADLRNQGYDAVIPYNWVAESNHPGAALRQAPRLESMVLNAVSQFPSSAPIDLHFIGHSEGAVVNSQAILLLQDNAPSNVRAGFLKDTMLDPHAASNAVAGQQYSVSNGILGWIARESIDQFQSKAKDPAVIVPANVDSAEVYYQHTPVSQTFGSNSGVYNLWGQVPVHGPALYYNVTGPGISHSGKFGVQDWYRLNVVSTLGDGAPFIQSIALTGAIDNATTQTTSSGDHVSTNQPVQYAGTAEPGATVQLYAQGAVSKTFTQRGEAVVNPDGTWSITTQPLAAGQYRVVAVETGLTDPAQRLIHVKPTLFLSTLNVDPAGTQS
jgi:hypothetical protein